MKFVTALSLLLLAACTAPITMQNPKTGQKVQCESYMDNLAAAQREAQCISDYQRQGFERIPN